jgi:hypothetical protein
MVAMKSMSKTVKRVIPATITIAGVTVAVSAIPVESPQTGAKMWAQSLTTVDRINYSQPERVHALPVEYRHALFTTMSTAEERAEFWRQVFKEYRRTHSLTAEQEQLLTRTESGLLQPATFVRLPLSRERSQQLAAARNAVSASLGSDAARELFVTAGTDRRNGAALPFFERVRHAWRVSRPKGLVAFVDRIATPVYAWNCNCLNSSECSYSQSCGGAACDSTSWGCGTWWCDACTSICGYYS